jgi:hypothetical protein
MARELQPVDITHTPDVLHLAEEVARSGTSRVLRRNNTDLAIISPVTPTRNTGRRRRATSSDDALWGIVGLADASDFPDEPEDVSSNVDEYLAEAYENRP